MMHGCQVSQCVWFDLPAGDFPDAAVRPELEKHASDLPAGDRATSVYACEKRDCKDLPAGDLAASALPESSMMRSTRR